MPMGIHLAISEFQNYWKDVPEQYGTFYRVRADSNDFGVLYVTQSRDFCTLIWRGYLNVMDFPESVVSLIGDLFCTAPLKFGQVVSCF